MHSQTQELQRYFDGELATEARMKLEQHLAACSTCQAQLAAWLSLSTVLQRWTLPADLDRLSRPFALPAKKTGPQLIPGLLGWGSGIIIILLFVLVQAIFWLSNQLNWIDALISVLGINGRLIQLISNLWGLYQVRPWYLVYLGESSRELLFVLALMLPILLYNWPENGC